MVEEELDRVDLVMQAKRSDQIGTNSQNIYDEHISSPPTGLELRSGQR